MYCIQTKDLRYGLHLGKLVHQTEANCFCSLNLIQLTIGKAVGLEVCSGQVNSNHLAILF